MFTEAMARRIEIWPVEKLVPYARNPDALGGAGCPDSRVDR